VSGARTLLRAAANPNYRRVLGSLAVSASGDWLYVVGFMVWVFARTNSPGWVAAAAIVRLLPYVVFGTLGGAVADRYGPRRVMVAADLTRIGIMLVLTAVIAAGAPVLAGIVLAAVSTTVATVYRPAVAALTPQLVGEDDLAAANSAGEVIQSLALLLGPAAGGLLLAWTSPAVAVGVNALTFAVSALLVAGVRLAPAASPVPAGEGTRLAAEGTAPAGEGGQAESGSTGSGGRTADLLRSRPVAVLLALVFVSCYLYGSENVVYLLLAHDQLGTGAQGFGYLLGASGLGGLLAAGLPGAVFDSGRPGRVLLVTCMAIGLPMALLSLVHQQGVAYPLVLLEGVGGIVLDIVVVTLLQRLAPAGMIGRVFGLLTALAAGGTIAGSLVSGAVVSTLGLSRTLLLTGLLVPVAALVASPVLAAIGRTNDQRRGALAGRVAVLEGLHIFEGASRAALEEVAAGMTEESVPAGTVVVREGEPADDFFVITEGAFGVTTVGTPAPELGPGDYFGEIGVLQHRPRTATVRAVTAGVLYRVPGTRFAAAVATAPILPSTLRQGIDVRLGRTSAVTHPARTSAA
jgi:predicted MFS family arabinose efflux permease